ncbi:hypothetical protein [uncultured Dokdonia sp.]|uniref:hypothetical protein n=1 Tax=uncultured Dokdonia sp. TaxID=575653 RepID=UPI0026204FAB|nr:hypothetical protein [uncultured Dokdonia sp.]
MDIRNIDIKNQVIPFLIPLALLSLLIFTSKSNQFTANPSLISAWITIDLILTVPLIYFLLIRKKAVPKNTVVIALLIGLFICYKIIPAENQTVLPVLGTWLLPILEVGILVYILVNLRKARLNYRQNRDNHIDFYTTVKTISQDLLPKFMARIIATEITVVYYAIINWKRRPLKNGEFSIHKKSASISILLGIMLIIGVEATVFHYILEQEGNPKAWLITFLSIYTLLQILGLLKSIIKRPISFEEDILRLRYGIMKETSIELNNIKSIVLSSKNMRQKTSRLSIFGRYETHNVILTLKNTETLYSLYGIKNNYTTISFYVDEPQKFFNKMCESIEKSQLKSSIT